MKYNLLNPLRGLAALWVLCFHLRSQEGFTQLHPVIENLFRHGHFGVPIFFIISGFCIMHSLRTSEKRRENPFSFLLRRAKRIYIPFWFSIILAALIPFLVQFIQSIDTGVYISPYEVDKYYHKYLSYSLIDWAQVFSLTKIFEPLQNISGLHVKFLPINGVYWSLAIEIQFYIIMFLSLWFKDKRNTFLLCITVLSGLIYLVLPDGKSSGLFVYFWHYFAFGIIINTLFSHNIKPSAYPQYEKIFQTCCGGVFCVLLGMVFLPNLGNTRGVFSGLFVLFVWLIEIFEVKYTASVAKKNFISLSLYGLGVISYSIYLTHRGIILLSGTVIDTLLPDFDLGRLFLIIICALIVGYCFYLVCERSFHQTKNKVKMDRVPSL